MPSVDLNADMGESFGPWKMGDDDSLLRIITSANIAEMSAGTNNPEINRILGTEGTLGEMLGLDADWAQKAIATQGNYGEIFAKNIGEETPIALSRGLNAQWTNGGLIYSPPFR